MRAAPTPIAPLLVALLAIAMPLLSGCAKSDTATTTTLRPAGGPMLQGVVVDEGIRPLGNVTVRDTDTNQTSVTGADGIYAFDTVATDRPLVLIATKVGYAPDARQVTVPLGQVMRLNFTLKAVTTLQPRMTVT